MREHRSLLFMGNEQSKARSKRLQKRLDNVLGILSAQQQGGQLTEDQTKELRHFVKDIGAAVLGRKVKLGKKLPYPTKEKIEIVPEPANV